MHDIPGAGLRPQRGVPAELAEGEDHSRRPKQGQLSLEERTTRRVRKRIEEAFGWIKTVGGLRKTRHRGTARVGWLFTLTATACNLVRLPKLLAAG
jgi:hypothetical protein